MKYEIIDDMSKDIMGVIETYYEKGATFGIAMAALETVRNSYQCARIEEGLRKHYGITLETLWETRNER